MADMTTLAAAPRKARGKGGARAVRREGRIPAIIYGSSSEPAPVSVDQRELLLEYNRGGFFSRVFELDVEGAVTRVLPRDVQLHPVSDMPLHIDFLRLAADTRVNVEVPVTFANEEEAPGLRRGGVLNVVRRTVELDCLPDSIPAEIIIDLTGREIGDSIHISHVALPDNVHPTIRDRDFTIATIAPPTVMQEAEAEEDEQEEEEDIDTAE